MNNDEKRRQITRARNTKLLHSMMYGKCFQKIDASENQIRDRLNNCKRSCVSAIFFIIIFISVIGTLSKNKQNVFDKILYLQKILCYL